MIEVLIAAVVAAIGFAAVFSLQINSMLTNISARDMAAGMNLAERYVEVLRRDSFAWVDTRKPEPFLSKSVREWHSFSEFPLDQNALASLENDREHGSAVNRQRFCVHYWLAPLDGIYAQMMNVRVRVIWPRNTLDAADLASVCPERFADGFEPDPARFFSITIPAIIRSSDGS